MFVQADICWQPEAPTSAARAKAMDDNRRTLLQLIIVDAFQPEQGCVPAARKVSDNLGSLLKSVVYEGRRLHCAEGNAREPGTPQDFVNRHRTSI